MHSLKVADKVIDMYNRRYKDGDDLFTMLRDSFTLVNVVASMKVKDACKWNSYLGVGRFNHESMIKIWFNLDKYHWR